MSTAQIPTSSYALDVSGTPRVPFGRLVGVELRKTRDTKAGLWLLISMAIVTALVMVIQLWVIVGQNQTATYNSFMQGTSFSIAIFLPILGILLLTSEWSQRTAMVTFALEPHRLRVVMAKLAVGAILAVAAVIVALVLGGICNLLYGSLSGNSVVWDMGLPAIGGFLLLQLLGIMTGFGFAALLLSSPGAIVAYMVFTFVLPGLFAIGAAFLHWFSTIQPWIDFGDAQTPLADASMSGKDWAQLVTSGLIWLGLPLALGLRRVLRAEVK